MEAKEAKNMADDYNFNNPYSQYNKIIESIKNASNKGYYRVHYVGKIIQNDICDILAKQGYVIERYKVNLDGHHYLISWTLEK